MAAPYNKLRSKVNRAIAAYLISAGAGSTTDTVPANTKTVKVYPNTTVKATLSLPEVHFVALRRVKVHISIKGSATQDPTETDLDAPRKLFDDRVSQVYDAMMQTSDNQTLHATALLITSAGRALAVSQQPGNPASDQVAADNADMVDFSLQAVYDMGEGDGEPSEDGTSWEEILMFDVLASPSNVD
jgi:hypothetical protein